MIIIIIIIIITFSGAIRDFFFYNLLTAPRTASNMHAQVARAQSCANHMQHIEGLSCSTCHVTLHMEEGTAQLLSLTEFKLHLFELFLLAEPLTDEGWEEIEVPGENPWR